MKIEYIANDGTRFNDEEQCREYEATIEMDKIANFRYFEILYSLEKNNPYHKFFVIISDEIDGNISLEILRCFLNKFVFDSNIILAKDGKTIMPMYKINTSNIQDYIEFHNKRPDMTCFFLTSQNKDYQLLPDKFNVLKLL